ncbi:hypothetical protein [Vibrio diazotrophicus]|nr:hypothetical protein [Vibrio diazotrophicus]
MGQMKETGGYMRFFQLCLIATMSILFGCSSGQMANNELVKRAESAAPSDITSTATILAVDGTVLREGTSDWVCYPGIPLMPGDLHPMCVDSVWQDFLKTASEGKPFVTSSMGISYMLQGDANVSNANPMATDPNNGDVWVKEGPHLMIAVPKYLLKDLSEDPYNGGPYVMWKDTPYAHIMVPIKNK